IENRRVLSKNDEFICICVFTGRGMRPLPAAVRLELKVSRIGGRRQARAKFKLSGIGAAARRGAEGCRVVSDMAIYRQLCRRASTNFPHRARERRDALKC